MTNKVVDLSTVDIAKIIRKEAKENYGLNRNDISVRAQSVNAVDIVFKTDKKFNVEAFCKFAKSFESYQVDEMTMEILSGGNTFIFISTETEDEE